MGLAWLNGYSPYGDLLLRVSGIRTLLSEIRILQKYYFFEKYTVLVIVQLY